MGPHARPPDELQRGRDAYESRSWLEAHASLSSADESDPLAPADLELLATSAYMLGRDDEWVAAHERAHRLYLESGDIARAARCAVWIGISFALRGDIGPASGWFARTQRLLDQHELDCAERGYLLIPQALGLLDDGQFDAALALAAEAGATAERFGDRDLLAFAVLTQGQALALGGRIREGLPLLDEAMVAVTTEQLMPVVTGIAYCAVILTCQQVFEIGRAREWTAALEHWWKEQPDMIAFSGRCLVHRAELLQLAGSWPDALEEARRARRRFIETKNAAAGLAHYREAELLRLQGHFAPAEDAYREASRAGWEPQPGLAQLRLSQARVDAAAAAIRRATGAATEPLRRAELLPAYVEIMLAIGETDEARTACVELEEVAARYSSGMLDAIAGYERGAVALATDDARAAAEALRGALEAWQVLAAPYEVARTRVLLAQACRALGDDDTCALELDASLAAFTELGATPDVRRVEKLLGGRNRHGSHGLSARELQVLQLIAAGKSNRDIAAVLVVSEHTVARHVQNIFGKLRVSSRTAATAFAFEHDLV